MRNKLVLIGGGGHCKSVLGAMLQAGVKVHGILDVEARVGEKVLGVPIIGTDTMLGSMSPAKYELLITIGSTRENDLRARIYEKLKGAGFGLPTFVARSAIIGLEASLGEGTVVLETAVVNTGAQIGPNCIVNTGAVVEHDAAIGESVHIATGARICGAVAIGERSFVGAGATVIQGILVGRRAVVGAGAVVTKNIPDGATVAGSPARAIKKPA